jgi:uncharacterized membrane protein
MSLTQTGTTLSGNRRLRELDATRGLIMILMALGLAALYLPCKAFVGLKRKSSLDSIIRLF